MVLFIQLCYPYDGCQITYGLSLEKGKELDFGNHLNPYVPCPFRFTL